MPGQVDELAQVRGVAGEQVARSTDRARPPAAGSAAPISSAARSRISASPVSVPTGSAPARHSLMPLYRAGLWLAVNIAPGRPRLPLA